MVASIVSFIDLYVGSLVAHSTSKLQNWEFRRAENVIYIDEISGEARVREIYVNIGFRATAER